MGLLSRAAGSTALAEDLDTEDSDTIKSKISQYYGDSVNFSCILLDNPGRKNAKDDFCDIVAKMVQYTGAVIPFSGDRPLILLPHTMDRELIAHRLSKNLHARVLLSFEADNPQKVISQINSQR